MTASQRERQQRAVDSNIAAIRAVRQIRAAVQPLALIADMQVDAAVADDPEAAAYADAVRRQLVGLRRQEREYVDDLLALVAEGYTVPAAYKRVEA